VAEMAFFQLKNATPSVQNYEWRNVKTMTKVLSVTKTLKS